MFRVGSPLKRTGENENEVRIPDRRMNGLFWKMSDLSEKDYSSKNGGAMAIPRTEDENKRIREAQRESILEAAKDVFARKGWGMTIADIAAAANVSQGLIYHYFANKEAVICELLKQTMQSDSELFQRVMQSGDTPAQRLEALVSSMLQPRDGQIHLFGIAVQASKGHSSSGNSLAIMRRIFSNLKMDDSDAKDLRELMLKRLQSVRDVMIQLIIEGQKSGQFAPDAPDKLAMMIFQSIRGLTSLALENPAEYDKYYPYTDIIMRMVMAGDVLTKKNTTT